LVVVDKKIVASTQYKEAGKTIRSPETPQAVLDYGDMVLKSVSYAPDRAWVMDVCESELGLRVLEVGTFSCSGFYACDPESIILAVGSL
jgi:hypothetical protein